MDHHHCNGYYTLKVRIKLQPMNEGIHLDLDTWIKLQPMPTHISILLIYYVLVR